MDLVTVQNDGQFDSGAQPVTTATTQQEICRIPAHGHNCLLSVSVAGGSIGDIQLLQAAVRDDPNPLVVCDGAGFNTPALANESYILPALAFPFGPGTFQVKLQGGAYELILQAKTASAAGVTVQVRGFLKKRSND
jgi:hypothetical protein